MERKDAEAETVTEDRAGSAVYPPAHFTGAATAASVGGPVSAGPEPAEERAGGAGHPPEHSTNVAMAASVGDRVSAGPASAEDGHGATGSVNTQRDEGGDETPRSARERRDPEDGKTEERGPQTVLPALHEQLTRGGR